MRTLRRAAFIAAGLLATAAPFFFPWQAALLLGLAAGLFYPPFAFFVGFLEDLLYYPGHGLPHGLIWGFVGTLLCVLVRYLARTRIMQP